MDAAEGSRLQIPIIKSQEGLITDQTFRVCARVRAVNAKGIAAMRAQNEL
jgi:hypothetical protein